MRANFAFVLGFLACTGCAGTLAMAPPVVPIQQACLPMKDYTLPFMKAAGIELSKLPAGDPLVVLVTDYKAMRDANRACKG